MVDTISDARAQLTQHVARFRSEGAEAEPVLFGTHRRPEAALIPYEAYQLLMELAEDAAIAQVVRERTTADTGRRTSLGEIAAELGIDLDQL